jgi:dTDP-4-amino-4,6-dideoxygalactose transaminase
MFMPPQPRFRFYHSGANYVSAARDLLTGAMNRGDSVATVEQRAANFTGVDHAIAMPQGRVGIYMLLVALLKPGQKVIMSPYTLYDVVNMVICAGGIPVFADLEADSCNISADEVERLIDAQTGAVMVTHLHGLICDIERIAQICKARGVPLLEDACQAFGAKLGGRRAGSFGDAGFFSFGRAKNINAFYGGMVVTKRRDLNDAIRAKLAALPFVAPEILLKRIGHCLVGDILTSPPVFSLFTFWLFRYGALHDVDSVNKQFDTEDNPVRRDVMPAHYMGKITPMQARLIDAQIDAVDENTRKRLVLANIYYEGLKDIPGIRLPPLRNDGSHIYLSFPVQVEDRMRVVKYLMLHGRDCVIQHIRNTAEMDCFAAFARDCPQAKRTAEEVLLLPTYPGYKPSEAQKNIAVLRRYFQTGNQN